MARSDSTLRGLHRTALLPVIFALATSAGGPEALLAQRTVRGEVRQLVSFTLLPGHTGAVVELYRSSVLPLYERDADLRSMRAFREAESPVPVDLVVVRSFDGLAGMDNSNEGLRRLAAEAGTSIGALYGEISAHASGHVDELIAMIPELGTGDPSAARLTAFLRYRAQAGAESELEAALEPVAAWEAEAGIASVTGRFLLSDGWTHLRLLGFDSLEAYEEYWAGLRRAGLHRRAATLTAARREALLVLVEELSVRD